MRTAPAGRPGKLIVEKPTSPRVQVMDPDQQDEIYRAAKAADSDIPSLQALPIAELMDKARSEGVETVPGLSKQELIFELLKKRIADTGLGWGEGVLDILPDGFGFLRSPQHHYIAGPDDIYVSPSQVRRLNLRQGHLLAGPVRPPKGREKYFALLHVEAVNGGTVEDLRQRIPFEELTPVLPSRRLRLEHQGCDSELRLLDLFAPMGKGQRTLILAPPQSGRTRLLTLMAMSILDNHADVYVIVLLIDDRPEDVTEMIANTGPDTRREVVASTFDEPASRHVTLAEMALAKAKRMVEAGNDVVILMDSLTHLVRAYNQELPHSGKILSVGLDAVALQHPKGLFGAARQMENGGSLSVVATVLTDTGSRMNDVIAEEFGGRANSEIVLDQHLAELHVYPALDVARTSTRREDTLLSRVELGKVRQLRRKLDGTSPRESLELLDQWMAAAPTNAELLDGLDAF